MNKMINISSGVASDNWETPESAVTAIEPYLKRNSTIWCPFDKDRSQFVKYLTKCGHTVINTHIEDGDDFFMTEPPRNCDYIISNPPYSCKDAIYKRLFELGVPFALLVNLQGFADSKIRATLFRENDIQVMYIYPRVCYIKDGVQTTGNIFQSGYLCGNGNILPKDLMIKIMPT